MNQTVLLIYAYWLYAFFGALFFWHKRGFSVLLPLSAWVLGGYFFLNGFALPQTAARGTLFTGILCLEVVLMRYAFPENAKGS